ncbi:hypothetical protein GNI_105880 [Gregarina niphandrodes]|uniref:Uncharacterized protein n=1 Tax=Gregarina niphandrodes TaxID=110365 RepID=A0A023B486_GRENI|nr:hypothetical protein GNI_105880 [Gregarina niphandrodes]EZG56063.1 hypothetical protein GNI_105880 [Gregarina niphandrodes]|eukprot:XP_011131352.1 hypothetical protein GNI_105880 [Gregarina niphandrodes]
MQHQEGCPLSSVAAYKAAALQGLADYVPEFDDSSNDLPCPDRRCSTWLDLKTWFGYVPRSLPSLDFQKCFADIAHGGGGIYERLAVLGEKALGMMCQIYISEKYSPIKMPFDLQRGYPPDMIRYIWTLKRTDRCCSLRSLSVFARTYLSTAQSMETATACARYVKAVIGYSIQAHSLMRTATANTRKLEMLSTANQDTLDADALAAGSGLIYDWATVLIDHIYDVQKLRSCSDPVECELVQDLQEFFGYPYDTLIPRVYNVIRADTSYMTEGDCEAQAQSGRDIVQLAATEYFLSLAQNAQTDPHLIDRWLRLELKTFMNSQVIGIFAATHFNLLPILNHMGPGGLGLTSDASPGLEQYARLFCQLLAATYGVVRESQSREYLPALIQRLRQIQLTLHMEELDIRINGPLRTPLALFQGIDIFRWSTISNWGHVNRYNLWQRHPRSKHLEAFLPVSDPVVRRRIRTLERTLPLEINNFDNVPRSIKALCPAPAREEEQGQQVSLNNVIPIVDADSALRGRDPGGATNGVYIHRFGTNKKPNTTPRLWSRLFKRTPATTAWSGLGLGGGSEKEGGTLWKPPFAAFMKPRLVNFNKGEAYVAPQNRRPCLSTGPKRLGDLKVHWEDNADDRGRAGDFGRDLGRGGDFGRGGRDPSGGRGAQSSHVGHLDPAVDSGSSSSSYCSSCSTCEGEQQHDCKGWNNVLREMQAKTRGLESQVRDMPDGGKVLITRDRATENAAVEIFRKRLGNPPTIGRPTGGIGTTTVGPVSMPQGLGPAGMLGLGGEDRIGLDRIGPDRIGPDRIDRFKKLGMSDEDLQEYLAFKFQHDPEGHKHLTVEGPRGTEFDPTPQNLADPNHISLNI